MNLPIPFSSAVAEIIGSDFTNSLLRTFVNPILENTTAQNVIIDRVLPIIRGRIPLELKQLLPWPMFHEAGFFFYELLWMQAGLPIVFPKNPRFDPKEVLEIIDKVKPFMLQMLPPMWSKIVEVPDIDRYDKRSLIEITSGGGICPAKLKKKMFEKFPNVVIGDGFGQTETMTATTWRFDSYAEMDKMKDRAVGRPLPGFEVRIVDENGKDVKQGEVGELLYKSPTTLMKEYYKDVKKTSEAFTEDNWFHSGDIGYFDEDGEVYIVDRKSELINVGGEKIYPHEVEEILESNPKVEYAGLMGVPDETYGKIPMALIKLREEEEATEDEIIDFCRDKMSGIKRPRYCVFVDEFPLNPAQKIMRRQAEEKFKREIEEGYERWKKAK